MGIGGCGGGVWRCVVACGCVGLCGVVCVLVCACVGACVCLCDLV